jgi:hypothetical protein
MTLLREKEAAGILRIWTDGSTVRVSTVDIYAHLLDLIVASNPVDGPARKARTPKTHFAKGYHRSRKPHSPAELAALARANARTRRRGEGEAGGRGSEFGDGLAVSWTPKARSWGQSWERAAPPEA